MHILWNLLGDRSKASSRVRAYWLDEGLRASGITSEYFVGDTKLDVIRLAMKMWRADPIIFQKQYSRWHVWLAKWGKALGKTVILDLDDAPSRTKNAQTLRNVERMIRACTTVTVGCRNLQAYVRTFNGNCQLIPSSIKLGEYEPLEWAAGDGVITLGWIGNGAHYCRDLVDILQGPLREVARTRPLRFRIVGACGQKELAAAFGAIPNLELELVDQIDWAAPGATRNALRGIDIGVYPLLDNEFNRYKCGFKALEYMALGLPVIASPVSANTDIVRDREDGFLCVDREAWIAAITELVHRPQLRREMGKRARERVEREFATRSAAEQLAAVLAKIPSS